MTQPGTNSDKPLEIEEDGRKILVLVKLHQVPDFESVIRWFLEDQPTSWAHMYTLDGILENIRRGRLQVVLYGEDQHWRAMCMFSVNQYEPSMRTMNIQFLTCREFFHVIPLWDHIESIAYALGCQVIESIAHPALAGYLCKKKDFAALGVYVKKDLRVSRRN